MDSLSTLTLAGLGTLLTATVLPAIVTFIICIIAAKILLSFFGKFVEKTPLDKTLKKFALSVVKILVYFMVIVIMADKLGIEVTSLLAVFSMFGLAISLSVQNSLSNLANGVLMIIAKPFVAGDFVEAGGVMGVVKEVGFTHTVVATPDNKIIHIPNSELAGGKIINYSSEELRRVDANFTASYDCKVEDVKASLLKAVKATDVFLDDPAVFINVFAYNSSNIEYVVRAWVKSADYWPGYFGLMENVKKAFDEDGIQMTYDHVNVHMIKD
ncbi:MAG: mechanosensitive ion channel [Firmicutes bacterium]|nr:mechanosensitive ion channel [Bacillota bacterium]